MDIYGDIYGDVYGDVYGGAMIDSGGFGCVYRPALRCAKSRKRHSGISKLQLKKDAISEYKVMKSILRDLKHIPNYKNFFILDVTKCTPNNLTAADKRDMDCRPLQRRNITTKNINKKLHNLVSLQLEDGGPTMKTVIRNITTFEDLLYTHKALVHFFSNGLLPMNEAGIVHGDLKLSNILLKKYARLIDWGFTYNTNTKYDVHRVNWFHFNLPFAVCFLGKHAFIDAYFKKTNVTYENAKTLGMQLLEYSKDDRHVELVRELFTNVGVDDFDEVMVDHLTLVLVKYVDDKTRKFNTRKYFQEVYMHNCDIWSMVICFIELIDFLPEHLSDNESVILYMQNIRNLLRKYICDVKYAVKPYDKNEILDDIKALIK